MKSTEAVTRRAAGHSAMGPSGVHRGRPVGVRAEPPTSRVVPGPDPGGSRRRNRQFPPAEVVGRPTCRAVAAPRHAEAILEQRAGHYAVDHLLHRATYVGHHPHPGRDQPPLEREGHRPTDQQVHPQLGHDLHPVRGAEVMLHPRGHPTVLRLDEEKASGDVEHRGEAVPPDRHGQSHRFGEKQLRCHPGPPPARQPLKTRPPASSGRRSADREGATPAQIAPVLPERVGNLPRSPPVQGRKRPSCSGSSIPSALAFLKRVLGWMPSSSAAALRLPWWRRRASAISTPSIDCSVLPTRISMGV